MTTRHVLHRGCIVGGLFVLLLIPVRSIFAQTEKPSVEARLKALAAQLKRYAVGSPKEKSVGRGRVADVALAIRKATLVAVGRSGQYFRDEALEEAVAAAEEALAALEKPATVETPRTGFQERAYLSAIDGNAEPYFLYVPTNYDEKREWPLLVFLHGYSPDLNVANWKDFMYSPTLEEVCQEEGVILLMPYGRSNTEFMGIGESDVLHAIRCVREEYRVDPRRVIISGVSMGGSGAYSIACHHPDLFAGVIAMSGRVDYYQWVGVARELVPQFKQVQVDADYARELLPNLQHVPVLIFHGARDSLLKVSQSRLMHKLLTDLGQTSRYVEFAWGGHNDIYRATFQHERFKETLRAVRSVAKPTRVHFRTFTIKYASAYWVKLDEIARVGALAEVVAEALGENKIALTCRNVAALTLGPDIPGVRDIKSVRVTVNGRPVKPVVTPQGAVQIRLLAAPEKAPLRKRVGLCGPIREAYDGPFAIVYPSANKPETAADRENAVRLAREWYAYAKGKPRLIPDLRLTEAQMRRFNLIVCGSPATNKLLQRINDKLPVRIEGNEYVVGPYRFPSENNGMQVVYPNPLNPNRYVLVVHGVAWGPDLQRNHKLDFLPDFIVYSEGTAFDGTIFPTNWFLCAGYFDSYWRFSEKSTWLEQVPEDVEVEDQPKANLF